MLSILYSDFEQFGCPNCGCDAARGSCVSGGGLSSATCRHCGLHFEVRGSTVVNTLLIQKTQRILVLNM